MASHSTDPVTDERLETFISGKFHWKSLLPHEQMSLAVEVMRLRYLMGKQFEFISESLEHKQAAREYRDLICKMSDGGHDEDI
ncbi:MAG: hypothetical protein Unbinned8622contig1005_11 [Prokaryotic dsDNA virus sp.]|nr:MAG: hypothetical protein Unbinned8622contig1005_11 [Prokaryotic dsDNA virus sp.]|tara:strand:+ start:6582 stop:6830 length:249 start_codon:yes stop_codon:yes gene_type:complete